MAVGDEASACRPAPWHRRGARCARGGRTRSRPSAWLSGRGGDRVHARLGNRDFLDSRGAVHDAGQGHGHGRRHDDHAAAGAGVARAHRRARPRPRPGARGCTAGSGASGSSCCSPTSRPSRSATRRCRTRATWTRRCNSWSATREPMTAAVIGFAVLCVDHRHVARGGASALALRGLARGAPACPTRRSHSRFRTSFSTARRSPPPPPRGGTGRSCGRVCVGLFVVFRMIRPLWLFVRHDLRVAQVTTLPDGSAVVAIRGRGLKRLRPRPGQFFLFRFLTPELWDEAHPFSMSRARSGDWIRITVKPLGDFSAGVAGLAPGTRVAVEGPLGVFHDRSRTSTHLVLAGAASGSRRSSRCSRARTSLRASARLSCELAHARRRPTSTRSYGIAQRRGAAVWTAFGKRGRGWSSARAADEPSDARSRYYGCRHLRVWPGCVGRVVA